MFQNAKVLAIMARNRIACLFQDEKGEVNIVAIVVLIGIAVLLALVFQEQIEGLIDSLFKTITKNATDAVGGGAEGE